MPTKGATHALGMGHQQSRSRPKVDTARYLRARTRLCSGDAACLSSGLAPKALNPGR